MSHNDSLCACSGHNSPTPRCHQYRGPGHPAAVPHHAQRHVRNLSISAAGQVILQQDHLLQSVYFIVRGFVDLTATLPLTGSASGEGLAGAKAAGFTAESDPDAEPAGSTVVLVDMLGPGDRFPERALLPVPAGAKQARGWGGGCMPGWGDVG